jgi:hypothetical protein
MADPKRVRAPKVDERYEECPYADIPADIRWKPAAAQRPDCLWRTFYTIGNVYKLIRILDTGAVTYFRLKEKAPVTPAAQLDAEPAPPAARAPSLHVGARVWFVAPGDHWYELEVVGRAGACGRRVTFKSTTGWDAKRESPWPHDAPIEFAVSGPLRRRLRHISERP